MKKGTREYVDIGKDEMQKLIKIARDSVNFASKFMENPIGFCESNNFKVYTGYSVNTEKGRTYVVVNKMGNKIFGIIWLFLDGKMPSFVINEDGLNKIIRDCDFLHIDKEIFMMWLNDNVEKLKEAYNKSVEEFKIHSINEAEKRHITGL